MRYHSTVLRRPCSKSTDGRPAKFAAILRGIDRVTAVVTGAVGDKFDQLAPGTDGWIGPQLIDEVADGIDDIEIVALAVAADVVGLAEPAVLQHGANGRAMIVDKQPVADILAIAIDRKRLAFERIQDHQGNQLLRKLKRAVVVGAVGGQYRQSEGVEVGAHQVIGSRFRCCIGAVGRVGRCFGERRIFGTQRSVDLIGGDMQKAE